MKADTLFIFTHIIVYNMYTLTLERGHTIYQAARNGYSSVMQVTNATLKATERLFKSALKSAYHIVVSFFWQLG